MATRFAIERRYDLNAPRLQESEDCIWRLALLFVDLADDHLEEIAHGLNRSVLAACQGLVGNIEQVNASAPMLAPDAQSHINQAATLMTRDMKPYFRIVFIPLQIKVGMPITILFITRLPDHASPPPWFYRLWRRFVSLFPVFRERDQRGQITGIFPAQDTD
jgi:hypothetical protein